MDAGELMNAFDGFGGGANGLFGERPLDDLGVRSQFADGAMSGLASPESLQSTIAVGEEIAFGGGDTDMGNAGGVLAAVTKVNGPKNKHLPSHDGIKMVIAIRQNAGLFLGGKGWAKPSNHPWRSEFRLGNTPAKGKLNPIQCPKEKINH